MPPIISVPVLLWTALLIFSPDGTSAATGKSVVSLNPPWNRIFKGEAVTFTCYGNDSLQHGSTRWSINNTVLEVTNSRLDIVNANDLNSGEYRCQKENFSESDSVYLHIFSDWLLLQATAEEVMEGESLFIRCHGWKNRDVKKVTYYKDGKALKYWYENHNISINTTTTKDSGIYSCVGRIWKIQYESSSLNITVKKAPPRHVQKKTYYRLQLFIPFLVVILFAVDTALFILTQQELKFLLMIQSTAKGKRPVNPRRKSDPKKD